MQLLDLQSFMPIGLYFFVFFVCVFFCWKHVFFKTKYESRMTVLRGTKTVKTFQQYFGLCAHHASKNRTNFFYNQTIFVAQIILLIVFFFFFFLLVRVYFLILSC